MSRGLPNANFLPLLADHGGTSDPEMVQPADIIIIQGRK